MKWFMSLMSGLTLILLASGAYANEVSIGTASGIPGSQVEVPITIDTNTGGIASIDIDITLDGSQLEYGSCAAGANLNTSKQAVTCNAVDANTVRLLITTTPALANPPVTAMTTGEMAVVTLRIKSGATAPATLALGATNTDAGDTAGSSISGVTFNNGSVTVKAPGIAVTPSPGVFSAANGSTDTEVFTVTNDGDADGLLVTSVDISGANETNFSLVGTTNCPGVAPGLAQSATCTITVQFAPDSIANFTAQLDIVSNAGTENITLTGTGTAGPAGEITITPAGPFDFGELLTGIEEETQIFEATNTGAPGSVVTISGAALNLLFGSPLSIVANTCTNGTELEKDESCLVTVKEAPIATGTAERTLTVTGADANSTALSDSVTIKGEGIEEARPTSNPAAGTSAASQSEIVGPEGSNDFTVVWGNAGNVPYDLSCALSGSDTSNVWSLADATATVAADGSHTVTTTCALPDTETYTETLTCTVTKPDQETLTYTHNYECVGLPPLPVPVDNKWALALLALMMLMAASFGFRFIARQ